MSETYHLVLQGDCREVLRELPETVFPLFGIQGVDCCVTSPPYYGLRSYGVEPGVWGGKDCLHELGEELVRGGPAGKQGKDGDRSDRGGQVERQRSQDSLGRFCTSCGAWRGCLGLEPTPQLWVEHLVECFEQVRQVMLLERSLWVNCGDSFANGSTGERLRHDKDCDPKRGGSADKQPMNRAFGMKPKDLIGAPWRLAFALQEAGWWLRMDNIWAKGNPLPESVRDRTTKAHDYLFQLANAERYWWDGNAIREPYSEASLSRYRYEFQGTAPSCRNPQTDDVDRRERERNNHQPNKLGRNKRSVWNINPQPFNWQMCTSCKQVYTGSEFHRLPILPPPAPKQKRICPCGRSDSWLSHFAVMPETLVEPCILASCPPGGWVLDPFAGAGTVGVVAKKLGRNSILVEANPDYSLLAQARIERTAAG